MSKESFCKAEERRLHYLLNFKLPNYYKKIGLAIILISFLFLIAFKFIEGEPEWVRSILQKAMLVGLLVITISREKIEDELVQSLRSKAFSIAFILGVLYVLIQPLVNYGVGILIEPNDTNFEDLGDFQVLWFLLVVYLTAFWSLKRKNS